LSAVVVGFLALTVVGHLAWLFLAAIYRAVTGEGAARSSSGQAAMCPRCSRLMTSTAGQCPACGLVLDGDAALEMNDVLGAVRQLQRFEDSGVLEKEDIRGFMAALQTRLRRLRGYEQEPHPTAAPVPLAETIPGRRPVPAEREILTTPAAEVPAYAEMRVDEPPLERLERILARCPDLHDLTATERNDALHSYCLADDAAQLARLSPPAQLGLARLLNGAIMTREALRAYRRLLEAQPSLPNFALVALEAGRIGAEKNYPDDATWFVERALSCGTLAGEQRREAEFLLRRLEPPVEVEEEILDALPIEMAPSAPSIGQGWRVVSEERGLPVMPSAPRLEAPTADPVMLPARAAVSLPPTPPPPPPEPAAPRPPRRTMGEVMAAFMEERNILWGELIGGMLIVGCSVALVISLWQTLEQIPYFPFLVFASITTALFGAGLYTLHHWKLESTSRGLLMIATLLVPLDFLVMAGLRDAAGAKSLLDLTVAAGSLVLFTFLLRAAGIVLLPEQRWLAPLAVVGAAASQLLVPEWPAGQAPALGVFLALGILPTACTGLATAGVLRHLRREEKLLPAHAHTLFAFLGIATFALAVALGFLGYRSSDLPTALERLATLIAIAGIAPVACGLVVHQRLADNADAAGVRTAGTAVALIGMGLMVIAIGLAWPSPLPLILVCALDFVVLTLVALRFGMAIVHAAALPCLALGYLTACHAIMGSADTALSGWLFSAESGSSLVLLVVVLGCGAEVIARSGRRADGGYYAVAAGAAALMSLFLVTVEGAGQPARAALVYALYGAGALATNFRWQRESVSYTGLGLLIAASLWALQWQIPGAHSLWAMYLSAEVLLLAAVRGVGARLTVPAEGEAPAHDRLPSFLANPLARTAEWTALLVVFLAMWPTNFIDDHTVWAFANVVTASFLMGSFLVLSAIEARLNQARLAGVFLLAMVVVFVGWAATRAESTELDAFIALSFATSGCALAITSLGLRRLVRAEGWAALLATAWRETAVGAGILGTLLVLLSRAFPGPDLNAWTLAALAGNALLLGWAFQRAALTWVGSGLFFASLWHALGYHVADRSLTASLMLALLLHATLSALASLFLHTQRVRLLAGASDERLHAILAEPLRQAALVASAAAVPLVAMPVRAEMLAFSGYVAWLAAFWLVVSLVERWPRVFTAFQAGLSVAVVYGVTAWLDTEPWVQDQYPLGLTDPRSLHAYGIGLAILGFAWVTLRFLLPGDLSLRQMLDARRPSFDEVLLGILVVGQLCLAGWGVERTVSFELFPSFWRDATGFLQPAHPHVFAGGSWLVLALLALLVGITLWQRWPGFAVIGLTLLALTVPLLTTGAFAAEGAAAVAVRWGLGFCLIACAVPLWCRTPLAAWARCRGIDSPADWDVAGAIRKLLIATCVVPVLFLTAETAWLAAIGRPSPVDSESSFARLGLLGSNLVPLLLVAAGLVGVALRERSAGYAFSAGIVLDAALMGGYALAVVLDGGTIGQRELVTVLQLGTLAAGVWAIVWLASQRWVDAWRDSGDEPWKQGLMTVQVGIAIVGNVALLIGAMGSLVAYFPPFPLDEFPEYGTLAPWALGVGSLLGWTALALTATAVGWRGRRTGSLLGAWEAGGIGLVAIAFLACNVGRWTESAAWGYRTLMLGWAGYALGWSVLGAWRAVLQSRAKADEAPSTIGDLPAAWVRIAGLLAVILGLKAAFWHHDQLWAAGAIALASGGVGVVAVGRRREEWAFAAGLGFNIAAMLAVWHYHVSQPLSMWWVYLVQANSIASGAGALLWLALRKRMYGTLELRLSSSILLANQILMGLLGNVLTLGLAVLSLLALPSAPSTYVERVGKAGVIALLLPMAASLWYAARASLRRRFFLVALHALGLGVVVACSAAPWDIAGEWLCYHVLTLSWVSAGMLTLTLGLITVAFRSTDAPINTDDEGRFIAGVSAILEESVPAVQRWAEIIGLLVVGLALRGVTDPHPWAPFWSAGATLAVSLMCVGMALWTGRQRHIYESGLLLNLAGWLVWQRHGPSGIAGFVAVNVLCAALGSAFWSVLEATLGVRLRQRELRWRWLAYSQFAAIVCIGALVYLVGFGLLAEVSGSRVHMGGALTWTALVVTAIAAAATLWNPRSDLAGPGLYVLGLVGIGLATIGHDLGVTELAWAATLGLGGYISLTSAVAWTWPRLGAMRRALALPEPESEQPSGWLPPVQFLAAGVVVSLSVWVSMTFESPRSFGAPLAVAFLLPAGVLLAGSSLERWAGPMRQATLTLGVLILAEIGWAGLGPAHEAPWLHRSAFLMTALALMTGAYAAAPGWLSARWSASARRLGPMLGALSIVVLVAVLAQEALLYQPAIKKAPMDPWAIGVIAIALAGLIAGGIRFAVRPGSDPFHLSERRRQLYVYAAEVVLVLFFLHLRLTVPALFGNLFAPYWTFFVMLIAFGGVGLGEFFGRKGLPVLAEPLMRTALFLPILPILAFWLKPPEALTSFADQSVPGMRPMLGYLERLPQHFDKYAIIWVLASLLYGVAAALRKSFKLAVIAALAGNFGLWCLLAHHGIAFVAHPQVWLIPVAVALLVAEQINRDRLKPSQALGLRYTALGLLYLSSTAEMFITGMGESLWPPIALMLLAVGGMMSGIMLRVRAYLFLGAGFLFLDIFAMIWHAAVGRHHTWVWWAAGIVLGMAILALFAVFEKKRNDVVRMIEQIKQWK